MVVVMAGLPGTGKSALARAIARQTGGATLDKDPLRAALFAPLDIEYSAKQDDFCMELMLQAATYLHQKNPDRIVILDGRTFSRACQIDRVVEYAQTAAQPWRIIECVCDEPIARARLQADLESGQHPAGNRTGELYSRVRDSWEPITRAKMVVDTSRPLAECADEALRWLRPALC